jgi:hypothetical protein
MHEFQAIQDAMWTLAQGLLIIAIPILVKAALNWVSVKVAYFKDQASDTQEWRIDAVLDVAVKIAEQLKESGVFPDGGAAKAFCVDYVQKEFDRLGVVLDVDIMADKIEGAYHEYRLSNKK